MTRTLPTSPITHTIEYNAVMMIATITEVELLSSSAVLSHLELFMFTRLEMLLKFWQKTLLFDIAGLETAYRKSEMLPSGFHGKCCSAAFYTRELYQSRSVKTIPVRLQNESTQPFFLRLVCCSFLQYSYQSVLFMTPLFLHYPREIVSSVSHSAYSHFIQQNDVTYICTWLEAFQQSLTVGSPVSHFVTFSSVKLYEFTVTPLHIHLSLWLNAVFTECIL